jgi:putative endonuclease
MYYVYVLRSEHDNGFYIGYSSNLRRRFRQHSEGNAFATSHRGPWKLIYYEAYLNQADAPGRERYLKSGSGRRFLKTQLRNYLSERPWCNRVAKPLRGRVRWIKVRDCALAIASTRDVYASKRNSIFFCDRPFRRTYCGDRDASDSFPLPW